MSMEVLALQHNLKGLVVHMPECKHVEIERNGGNVAEEHLIEVEDGVKAKDAVADELGRSPSSVYIYPCVKKEERDNAI